MLKRSIWPQLTAIEPAVRSSSRIHDRHILPSPASHLLSTRSYATSPAIRTILTPRTACPLVFSSLPSQASQLQHRQARHASHNAQGAANSAKSKRPGKRLGAKKTSGQYVVPGNIIFRQRGTKWFPGENCARGRDHTIYSLVTGYVKYYKDPLAHPDRQYIGVALNREDKLPYPRNAPSKRRLGMEMHVRVEQQAPEIVKAKTGISTAGMKGVTLRDGYMFREANWEIGRAPEIQGVQVREFDAKDRWFAWRKKTEKLKRVAQMKDTKKKRKPAKKPAKAKR